MDNIALNMFPIIDLSNMDNTALNMSPIIESDWVGGRPPGLGLVAWDLVRLLRLLGLCGETVATGKSSSVGSRGHTGFRPSVRSIPRIVMAP